MKRIVTISREFGSGGRSVGKKLAERLGVKYYDKEVRYRYKICKFRHCKPSMAGYNLPLYQRHCCISSTKAEQPYL